MVLQYQSWFLTALWSETYLVGKYSVTLFLLMCCDSVMAKDRTNTNLQSQDDIEALFKAAIGWASNQGWGFSVLQFENDWLLAHEIALGTRFGRYPRRQTHIGQDAPKERALYP